MMYRRVLIIGLVLSVGVALGFAEDEQKAADQGGGFFLESIVPDSTEAQILNLMPNPNEYEINIRLSSGLSLQRNFQRSEVGISGSAFSTGIKGFSGTTATLNLRSRTTLGFTREETTVEDVLAQMMSRSQVTGMSLTQGFGRGSSEGSLSFSRLMRTDETPDKGALRTLIQSLDLSTGLGRGAQLQAGATRKESEEPGRLSELGYEGHLTAALSGGEGSAHYEALERLLEGRAYEQTELDIAAPFTVHGATAVAEHHVSDQRTDSSSKKKRTTSFALPLNFLRTGASASYAEEAKITSGVRKQTSTLSLVTPLSLLGHESQVEHIRTEYIDGDSLKQERTLRLTAQFDDSQGALQRTETVIPSEHGLQRQRRTMIQSPKIGLGDSVTVAAGHLRQDVVGVENARTTHLDLTAKPLEPLDIAANYKIHDRSQERETRDRAVQTRLSLSSTTSLRASFSELEELDGSPAIVRQLELKRDKHSEQDLGLRFGYTTFGAQEEGAEPSILSQISFGQDTKLSLNAIYSEYDEKKLKPLSEPTTSMELRVGDPTKLGLRAAYTDQAGRPEPERSIGLAMKTLGGALRLDYVRNPLGPRGKEVLLTDLYELGLQRKVFGAVGLDLGYKYCDATRESSEQHYFKLQLDGGQVERGGQVAFSYLSGHFVPYPKKKEPPSSLLHLKYEKRWPGRGQMILSLTRETPPELTVGIDDEIEAEARYQMEF